MADTGAPWNIPYIEPTDLVRNYPVANELMADAIAAGLTAAGNPGIGANVVQTVKTDTFTTSSVPFVDVTGVSATITPSTDTSKILVTATGVCGSSAAEVVRMILVRDSTDIAVAAGGTAPQTTQLGFAGTGSGAYGVPFSISFLDSPATAAAVTYKLTASASGSAAFIGRAGVNDVRSITTITAIEVAA